MDIAYQLLWKTPSMGETTDLSLHELTHSLDHGRFSLIAAGANHEQLRSKLEAANYRITPAVSNYAGSTDSLFMVHDPNERDMVSLAERYKQQSVTIAEFGLSRLICTAGPNKGSVKAGRGWSPVASHEGNCIKVETTDGETVRFRLDF
jgi:hypothetical protein